VTIGRAVVRRPKVFLFDEPLSNLDAALRVHMRGEIARMHRDFESASIVYVTHDQTEAMALADKIVLLRAGEGMVKHGSVAQVGLPLELYHRPNDLFVAGFIGTPRMNFLPARVSEAAGGMLHLEIDAAAGGGGLQLPSGGRSVAPGSPVTLGIRPEHMAPAVAGHATITRKVQKVEHFGEYSYVYLEGAAGEDLIVKVAGLGSSVAGERQSFLIDADQYHLFDADGFAMARQSH
jgi:multiple sugar transport system ATP-binding protein